ncbi:MAG TPA: transglycosylase SLT domain-containing protein, partial [Pyrinomonadaceae bacterium]|nr:transglycosylase SLT domain-containing protein [Pyrinomonadaceae bacterium]
MKSSKTNRRKPRLDSLGPVVLIALLIFPFSNNVRSQSTSDASLNAVRASDQIDRAAKGRAALVTAAEHMRRAAIYMANRAFAPAREHWQAVLDNYPNDTNVPAALYGIARSLYQERRYEEARLMYERVAHDYPETKEGREGSNFAASALLRMGKGAEAAARYEQYINRYPSGERVDTAHLNIIDGYREAGRAQDAILWIDRTRQKFAGTPTETSAIFARLRLDIALSDWNHAVQSADELLQKPINKAANTSADEVLYLKAHALERSGQTQDAIRLFSMIPDSLNSYYGGLATSRLAAIDNSEARQRANERSRSVQGTIDRTSADYPTAFAAQVVRESKKRGLDPRLVLALMKQESQFKPNAKSPAAARGLLQLTIDAAQKYSSRAGVKVTDESLYQPAINIAVGSEYIAELSRMF